MSSFLALKARRSYNKKTPLLLQPEWTVAQCLSKLKAGSDAVSFEHAGITREGQALLDRKKLHNPAKCCQLSMQHVTVLGLEFQTLLQQEDLAPNAPQGMQQPPVWPSKPGDPV